MLKIWYHLWEGLKSDAISCGEGDTNMSSNWITTEVAVTIISKHSHHLVSPQHVRTLVNRGKIGVRSSHQGILLLKRSDVEATHVALGTGNRHSTDRAET